MEFELPKINVSIEYDEEKDEIVFVINGVEKRVKTEDMITEMEKLHEQNTALEQEPCEDCISRKDAINAIKRTVATEQIKELKRLPSIQPKPKTDVLDKIRAEISKSKTEHEMQLAENNIKGKLLVSHIYCDIVSILDKYKAEKE